MPLPGRQHHKCQTCPHPALQAPGVWWPALAGASRCSVGLSASPELSCGPCGTWGQSCPSHGDGCSFSVSPGVSRGLCPALGQHGQRPLWSWPARVPPRTVGHTALPSAVSPGDSRIHHRASFLAARLPFQGHAGLGRGLPLRETPSSADCQGPTPFAPGGAVMDPPSCPQRFYIKMAEPRHWAAVPDLGSR